MTSSRENGAAQSVAIVGIGCRFPGGVSDADSFWQLLREGRDVIGEIPPDRFDLAHYYDARPATPGRVMTRWGGFLTKIDEFDPLFFGISPREAERLDPQQRLLLETAWEALEDAGQNVSALEGSATGVFVGQWLSDFENRLFTDAEGVDFYMTTGSGRYASSGRLSYLLGLTGPSLTIDTACSSSLIAVHLAVGSLRSGECTVALAGGANVILQPHISVAYSQSRMMAPDGRCKFGDASGDGYVRSEGAALIVLKRLDRALADGDRIYAVIRGSASNNDGRSSGSMGTPSRVGQEALLRSAYRDAQLSPGRVGYVEAHGTGTRAGDPVELGALSAVLAEGRPAGHRARVGSVKTNFGHTEGAAGIAGLIKATLALHHEAIPPSLHCKTLNPAVPWEQAPVEIARQLTEWRGPQRFAGVSAFGIAGANAHVVLESAPTAKPVAAGAVRAVYLLPVSARSAEALRALAGRYADKLESDASLTLASLCATAARKRTHLDQRAVVAARSRDEMIAALRRFAGGESALAEGSAASKPQVAFIVPGQGAQWTGMARELSAAEPVFRTALERCDQAARRYVDWSIVEQLMLDAGAPGYLLNRIDVIQPVLIAMAIAYAEWLASLGVKPDAVVGHSMGEVGAAYLAGVLDLDQAMRIICRRSVLMGRTSGRGAMAMVDLPMADAEKRLVGRESQVGVAVSNSPRSCVISGDPAAVNEVLAECERDGVFCRLVKVDVASHSPQMEAPAAELTAELSDFAPSAAHVPIYSTVLGCTAAGPEFDARYWGRNMRQPVRFTDAVSEMLAAGCSVFVELGPHPVLVPAVQQTAQSRGASGVSVLACGRRQEPDPLTALAAVAGAWTSGASLDWSVLAPNAPFVSLPSYPWQRERYWCDAASSKAGEAGKGSRSSKPAKFPMLGVSTTIAGERAGTVWDTNLIPARDGYLLEHRLHGAPLLAASVYVELALEALQEIPGAEAATVRDLQFENALHMPAEGVVSLQMHSLPSGEGFELSWYSAGESGWLRHARAGVTSGLAPASPSVSASESASASKPGLAPLSESVESIRARCSKPVDSGALYAALEARGAAFGPTLRSITQAWTGDGEMLADLSMRASDAARERRCIPAAALDACFQLAVSAGPAEGLWLPSALASVRRGTAGSGPLFVHARQSRNDALSDALIDVRLFDEQGVVLELRGIRLERLGASVASDPGRWLYDIAWKEVEPTKAVTPVRRWLIVHSGTKSDLVDVLADALANAIRARGEEHQFVTPGDLAREPIAAELKANDHIEVLDLRGIDVRVDADGGASRGAGAGAAGAAPGALAAALNDLTSLASQLASVAGANVYLRALTANARAVLPQDAGVLVPAQAAFWGAGATLAVEHGNIWAGCVDVDRASPGAKADAGPSASASAIVAHAASAARSDVAVRGDKTFTPRLRRFERPAGASSGAGVSAYAPAAIRSDASYLITGGLGGVGLEVARWLAQRGARRLVILGRTPVPPRAAWQSAQGAVASIVGAIRSIEAIGANVHYASVDVGNAAALQSFLATYESEGWPALRGVVHAAGITDDRLITQLDQDSWSRVLQGKVLGAMNLDRALPDLDFFVLFSSLAAWLPEPGQCSYAAANAVLDSLAARRAAEGKPAASINWGVWSGLGVMKGDAGRNKLQQLEQRGMTGFSAEKALPILGEVLRNRATNLIVLPVDWSAYHKAAAGREPSLVQEQTALVAAAAASTPNQVSLQDLDPAARRKHIEAGVRDAAARVLKLNPARIDARKPLGSMGLSSLLAMELRNRLELLVGRSLSATLVWNYPTIEGLVGFLAGDGANQDKPAANASVVTAAPSVAPVEVAKVAGLTDADAARLLRRRR